MARKPAFSHVPQFHQWFDSLPDWLTVADAAHYLRLGRDSTYALFRRQKAVRFCNLLRPPKHRLDPNGRMPKWPVSIQRLANEQKAPWDDLVRGECR